MTITLNGTTGITTPDLTSTDDITANGSAVLTSASDVAASQITTALNATGSAPIYAARAWVNFNGTGTVAIRAAGNVSSITDNGTGVYYVNFTTNMPDANYAVVATNKQRGGVTLDTTISTGSTAVSNIEVYSLSAGSTTYDSDQICVTIFR